MEDVHVRHDCLQSLDPAITKTTRAGMPIDRQGYECVEHVALIGMSADILSPSVRISLALDESDDGTNWGPVLDDSHVGAAGMNADGAFAVIDDRAEGGLAYSAIYLGDARYSRVRVILDGVHKNGTPIGAVAFLRHAWAG